MPTAGRGVPVIDALDVGTVGTLALLSILLVERVFHGLKQRGVDVAKIATQIDALHRWHNKEDDEGVKIWYVRHTLEKAIVALSENVTLQTTLLSRIDRRLEDIESRVKPA